jgi:prevent-host-death family protein
MTVRTVELHGNREVRLYALGMVQRLLLGVQELRMQLAKRVDALAKGEETIVQKRGKAVGALISMDDYRKLREVRGEPTDL